VLWSVEFLLFFILLSFRLVLEFHKTFIFVSHLSFEHLWLTTPHIHGFHLVFTQGFHSVITSIVVLILTYNARRWHFLALLAEAQGGQELPEDARFAASLFLCLLHHRRGIGGLRECLF
jgi:hypothetical protein